MDGFKFGSRKIRIIQPGEIQIQWQVQVYQSLGWETASLQERYSHQENNDFERIFGPIFKKITGKTLDQLRSSSEKERFKAIHQVMWETFSYDATSKYSFNGKSWSSSYAEIPKDEHNRQGLICNGTGHFFVLSAWSLNLDAIFHTLKNNSPDGGFYSDQLGHTQSSIKIDGKWSIVETTGLVPLKEASGEYVVGGGKTGIGSESGSDSGSESGSDSGSGSGSDSWFESWFGNGSGSSQGRSFSSSSTPSNSKEIPLVLKILFSVAGTIGLFAVIFFIIRFVKFLMESLQRKYKNWRYKEVLRVVEKDLLVVDKTSLATPMRGVYRKGALLYALDNKEEVKELAYSGSYLYLNLFHKGKKQSRLIRYDENNHLDPLSEFNKSLSSLSNTNFISFIKVGPHVYGKIADSKGLLKAFGFIHPSGNIRNITNQIHNPKYPLLKDVRLIEIKKWSVTISANQTDIQSPETKYFEPSRALLFEYADGKYTFYAYGFIKDDGSIMLVSRSILHENEKVTGLDMHLLGEMDDFNLYQFSVSARLRSTDMITYFNRASKVLILINREGAVQRIADHLEEGERILSVEPIFQTKDKGFYKIGVENSDFNSSEKWLLIDRGSVTVFDKIMIDADGNKSPFKIGSIYKFNLADRTSVISVMAADKIFCRLSLYGLNFDLAQNPAILCYAGENVFRLVPRPDLLSTDPRIIGVLKEKVYFHNPETNTLFCLDPEKEEIKESDVSSVNINGYSCFKHYVGDENFLIFYEDKGAEDQKRQFKVLIFSDNEAKEVDLGRMYPGLVDYNKFQLIDYRFMKLNNKTTLLLLTGGLKIPSDKSKGKYAIFIVQRDHVEKIDLNRTQFISDGEIRIDDVVDDEGDLLVSFGKYKSDFPSRRKEMTFDLFKEWLKTYAKWMAGIIGAITILFLAIGVINHFVHTVRTPPPLEVIEFLALFLSGVSILFLFPAALDLLSMGSYKRITDLNVHDLFSIPKNEKPYSVNERLFGKGATFFHLPKVQKQDGKIAVAGWVEKKKTPFYYHVTRGDDRDLLSPVGVDLQKNKETCQRFYLLFEPLKDESVSTLYAQLNHIPQWSPFHFSTAFYLYPEDLPRSALSFGEAWLLHLLSAGKIKQAQKHYWAMTHILISKIDSPFQVFVRWLKLPQEIQRDIYGNIGFLGNEGEVDYQNRKAQQFFGALTEDSLLKELSEEEQIFIRILQSHDEYIIKEEEPFDHDANLKETMKGNGETILPPNQDRSLAGLIGIAKKERADLSSGDLEDILKLETSTLDQTTDPQEESYLDDKALLEKTVISQDKKGRLWVREWIQNSRDALLEAKEEDPEINIRSFFSQGQWVVSVADTVGMSLPLIIQFLLNPDASTKRASKDNTTAATQDGLFGQGFFTGFASTSQIRVISGIKGRVYDFRLQPIYDTAENIQDIRLLSVKEYAGSYKGTTVQWINDLKESKGINPNGIRQVTRAHAMVENGFVRFLLQKYCGLLPNVKLVWNGKEINEKFKVLARVPFPGDPDQGSIELLELIDDQYGIERVTTNHLYISQIEEGYLASPEIPSWLKELADKRRPNINFPQGTPVIRSRTAVSNPEQYQDAIKELLFEWVLDLYEAGEFSIPGMPPYQEFIQNPTHYSQETIDDSLHPLLVHPRNGQSLWDRQSKAKNENEIDLRQIQDPFAEAFVLVLLRMYQKALSHEETRQGVTLFWDSVILKKKLSEFKKYIMTEDQEVLERLAISVVHILSSGSSEKVKQRLSPFLRDPTFWKSLKNEVRSIVSKEQAEKSYSSWLSILKDQKEKSWVVLFQYEDRFPTRYPKIEKLLNGNDEKKILLEELKQATQPQRQRVKRWYESQVPRVPLLRLRKTSNIQEFPHSMQLFDTAV